MQKPASATAKEKKLLLFPGDPLIKTLKPDYYIIVDPGSLDVIYDSGVDPEDDDYVDPEEEEEELDPQADTRTCPERTKQESRRFCIPLLCIMYTINATHPCTFLLAPGRGQKEG